MDAAASSCCASSCDSVSRFRQGQAACNVARRQAEAYHQREVLDGLEEAQAAGLSQAEALRCARISCGTLRNWRRRQPTQGPLPPRGRPPRCATRSERQAALAFLKEHGSHVPLHALREQLPEVARAELDDLGE